MLSVSVKAAPRYTSTDDIRLEHAEARCADTTSRVAVHMTKSRIRAATSLVKDNEDRECVVCGNADDRGGISALLDRARSPRSRVEHTRMPA